MICLVLPVGQIEVEIHAAMELIMAFVLLQGNIRHGVLSVLALLHL